MIMVAALISVRTLDYDRVTSEAIRTELEAGLDRNMDRREVGAAPLQKQAFSPSRRIVCSSSLGTQTEYPRKRTQKRLERNQLI